MNQQHNVSDRNTDPRENERPNSSRRDSDQRIHAQQQESGNFGISPMNRDKIDSQREGRSPGRDRSRLSRGGHSRENSTERGNRYHKDPARDRRHNDMNDYYDNNPSKGGYRSAMITRKQSRDRASRMHDDMHSNGGSYRPQSSQNMAGYRTQ